MPLQLMGKKRGMTMLFDEEGRAVACTVIEVEPNLIAQIKTVENDGYAALQMGCEKMKAKDSRTIGRRLGKPRSGHFAKNNLAPRRRLHEARLDDVSGYSVGQELDVSLFRDLKYVDVIGLSKGRGYQGVMKKFGFAGASKGSHGAGSVHRHAGSTGMRSTPGRCLKGGPRASQMGRNRVSQQNLRLFRVDEERHLLIVKGCVPGPVGGALFVRPSLKKHLQVTARAGKRR